MSKATKETHSKNYDKFKGYYESGFWIAAMLKNAVVKGKITAEEYQEITGGIYGTGQ